MDQIENIDFTLLGEEENNRNKYCGRYSLVGLPNDNFPSYRYCRLHCKSRKCSYCAPRRAIALRNAIAEAAVRHSLNRMLTLTLDPTKLPEDADAVKFIRDCWAKLRVYFQRRSEAENLPPLSFVQVLEFHESGRPHLHVLISQYVPRAWIKDAWERLGGGWNVDIRFVEMQKAANYISKYLTKERLMGVKGKTRIYTTSRDIKLFPKKGSGGKWEPINQSVDVLRLAAGEHAFSLAKDRLGKLLAFSVDFSILDVYPFVGGKLVRRSRKRNVRVPDEDS